MASTWGTNVWGSNSWQSDVNSVAPSGNVISLSIGTEEAFNTTGWGGQFWGSEEWGNLFDETVQVTGLTALQLNIGDESVTGEINAGWGGGPWGENGWGIFGDALVSGFTLTTAVASVSVTAEINIGWGGLTWGAGNWGDLANPNVAVTGQALTISQGNEENTADANVSVTGIGRTVTLAGAVAGTSVDPIPTGIALAAQQTSAFAGELVVVEVTSPVSDEWGTESWGQGFWGEGDGVTVFVGTDTVHTGDANVSATGVSASGSLGTLGQASIYEFTGVQAAVAQNSVFGGELVIVPVTTASAQPWGFTTWGEGQWGQSVGTDISQGGEEVAVPSVEVDVTSVTAVASTGQESIKADANLTLTTAGLLQTSLGDEDAFTNVTVSVTGQTLGPIVIGDYLAGISITANPTGVTGTVTAGIMGINAWAVVDPGASPTWTVVDKAA